MWEKIARRGEGRFFEEAVFSVGFNLFLEGRRAAGKTRVEHWERAVESFKRHLDHVGGMKEKDAKVVKRAIGSIHFSCRILVHSQIDRPDRALEISEGVGRRFPDGDPKLVNSILSRRIEAQAGLGRIAKAGEDLETLEARYKKNPLGWRYLSDALAVMAEAYERAAEAAKKKDPKRYESLLGKAGRCLLRWVNLNPVSDPAKVAPIAEKLFFVAESRKGPRELYERCLLLFKQVLFQKERDKKAADVVQTIHLRIVRCLVMTGRHDDGIRRLEEYLRSGTATHEGTVKETLADCYRSKAEALPRQRDAALRKADKIYSGLAERFTDSRLFNEHTWRLLHKRAECLWLLEEYGVLERFFRSYEVSGYAPRWDGNEWGFRDRFEELRRKLAEKVPTR
jgi:hypothetical protein